MKKLEKLDAFKGAMLDLKKLSNVRGGNKTTAGVSKPSSASASGCITYSSDVMDDNNEIISCSGGVENFA